MNKSGNNKIPMNNKESVICEFEIDFNKSFCWRSNLSNNNLPMSGLETAMEIEARSETGVENYIPVWSEIGSGFGEPGGKAPPRIPGVPELIPVSLIRSMPRRPRSFCYTPLDGMLVHRRVTPLVSTRSCK